MMRAGQYYIGDLCYVMHDAWDEVCDILFKGVQGRGREGEFTLKDGRKFALYSTAYGDGTYYDQQGREYGVDAGCIGCIHVDNIDTSDSSNFTSGGQIVSFDRDFNTDTDGENLTFGDVTICTGDYDEEPEEEEYDEETY